MATTIEFTNSISVAISHVVGSIFDPKERLIECRWEGFMHFGSWFERIEASDPYTVQKCHEGEKMRDVKFFFNGWQVATVKILWTPDDEVWRVVASGICGYCNIWSEQAYEYDIEWISDDLRTRLDSSIDMSIDPKTGDMLMHL